MKKYLPYLAVLVVPVAAALFLAADRAQQSAQPRDASVSISQEHTFSSMAGQSDGHGKPKSEKPGKPRKPGSKGKPGQLRIGESAPNVRFTALDGSTLSLADWQGKLPLVVLADTTCPCVKAYDGRMKALAAKYPDLRVVYAFPSPMESAAQIRKFSENRKYSWPVVHDREQAVMASLGGSCTTESFLFDRAGVLRYHGRIDDNIYDAPRVKVRDLENAVTAVISGQNLVKTEIPAYGCVIPKRSGHGKEKTRGKSV